MTVMLFTDAASKNGWSSWAYRSTIEASVTCEVVKTMNTASMEILAILKGLENIDKDEEVIVVSDFMGAIVIINEPNSRKSKNYIPGLGDSYHKMLCSELRHQAVIRHLDAIWVASKAPCKRHVEVDQESKDVLNEFLGSLI